MSTNRRVRQVTCEVAGPGHPDKLADQVADAVVDAIIAVDPLGRCGCEVMVDSQFVVVAGQTHTSASVDVPRLVREVLADAGYSRPGLGFDAQTCAVLTSFRTQSPEISEVIDRRGPAGASDQGVVFGYACDETNALLPLPLQLARDLSRELTRLRRSGEMPYLRPDTKTQVTVEYDLQARPVRVQEVVLAAQHDPDIDVDELREALMRRLIEPTIDRKLIDGSTKYTINKLGRFVYGGPAIDTGMTGRKIIADTYGGVARIGGGALSGKDPTKLDRTGAYFGRYVAKNLVAAGLAAVCEVAIAYAFGAVDPVSTSVETFTTGILPEDELIALVGRHFDFRPSAMISDLDLQRPIYGKTALEGHFGNSDFPWERTDRADLLRRDAGI